MGLRLSKLQAGLGLLRGGFLLALGARDFGECRHLGFGLEPDFVPLDFLTRRDQLFVGVALGFGDLRHRNNFLGRFLLGSLSDEGFFLGFRPLGFLVCDRNLLEALG